MDFKWIWGSSFKRVSSSWPKTQIYTIFYLLAFKKWNFKIFLVLALGSKIQKNKLESINNKNDKLLLLCTIDIITLTRNQFSYTLRIRSTSLALFYVTFCSMPTVYTANWFFFFVKENIKSCKRKSTAAAWKPVVLTEINQKCTILSRAVEEMLIHLIY